MTAFLVLKYIVLNKYMVLTTAGKQEKVRNFKIFLAIFHEKHCNNLENSNICLKKEEYEVQI